MKNSKSQKRVTKSKSQCDFALFHTHWKKEDMINIDQIYINKKRYDT